MVDPEFVKLLKNDFVAMAGSDVEYNQLSDEAKLKGEFRWLNSALGGQKHGIHQGIYVVSPSGEFIDQINTGWPLLDVASCRARLRAALARYKKMPKGLRVWKKLALADRSRPLQKKVVAAADWLQLKTTARAYDFAEMNRFDIRHPRNLKIDKLWFTESEARQLVPGRLTVGSKRSVDRGVFTRMAYNNHFSQANAAWHGDHLKKGDFSVSVEAVKGDLVALRYQGGFSMRADYQYNKSSLQGSILGKAVWNSKTQKFTRLTLVVLSAHDLKELKSNMHRGATKRVESAVVIELDPQSVSDKGLPPGNWRWGYPEYMRKLVKIK